MELNDHVKQVQETLNSDAHFFIKSAAASNFQDLYNISERDAAKYLGVSKSSMHRFNTVAKTPQKIQASATKNNTGFYAVYRMMSAPKEFYSELKQQIITGKIRTHKQVMNYLDAVKSPKKKAIMNELERIKNLIA